MFPSNTENQFAPPKDRGGRIRCTCGGLLELFPKNDAATCSLSHFCWVTAPLGSTQALVGSASKTAWVWHSADGQYQLPPGARGCLLWIKAISNCAHLRSLLPRGDQVCMAEHSALAHLPCARWQARRVPTSTFCSQQ